MTQPDAVWNVDEDGHQLTLFGEGDHGDLTPEEIPVYSEQPGGVMGAQYLAAYPLEDTETVILP